MEERKQFTFYLSIFKAIRKIKKKTDRADAYDAICAYALFGEEPDLEAMTDSVSIAYEHGKKPTAAQRRLMDKRGLDSRVWLVVKDTPQNMELVHRHSDRTRRVLPKEVTRCAEQNPE